jgi:hypothetical protein
VIEHTYATKHVPIIPPERLHYGETHWHVAGGPFSIRKAYFRLCTELGTHLHAIPVIVKLLHINILQYLANDFYNLIIVHKLLDCSAVSFNFSDR